MFTALQSTTAGCITTSTNSVTVNVISLPAPSTLSTSNITFTSARLNWNAVAGANHYDVRVREVGTTSWQLFTNVPFTYKNKYGLTQALHMSGKLEQHVQVIVVQCQHGQHWRYLIH